MKLQSKVCGISDIDTLEYITNHPFPPEFIGFIVNYKKSKRYLEHSKLKKVLEFLFFYKSFSIMKLQLTL